jgi:hypothetical protein
VDSDGNLYIADSANNTIRKMTPGGVVTTLGGMPGITGGADGQGSLARVYYRAGVALDSAGTLYVADFFLSTIRKGFPPPRIFNAGFIGGNFSFNLSGPPGQLVILEAYCRPECHEPYGQLEASRNVKFEDVTPNRGRWISFATCQPADFGF